MERHVPSGCRLASGALSLTGGTPSPVEGGGGVEGGGAVPGGRR